MAQERSDSTSRDKSVLRVFCRYLGIAVAVVSMLAAIQFLAIDHMPGWETGFGGMSEKRMVNFRKIGDGRCAVAEYYCVDPGKPSKSIDLSLKLIEFDNSAKTFEIKLTGLISARCSPDSQHIAMGLRDGSLCIRAISHNSVASTELTRVNFDQQIRDIQWSADGARLLLSFDGECKLVDRTGKLIHTIPSEHSAPIVNCHQSNCFCFATSNRYRLFDWNSALELHELPIEPHVRSLTFTRDVKYVAYLQGCDLVVHDLKDPDYTWNQKVKVAWSAKNAIAFCDDDLKIAVVQQDTNNRQDIRVFDLRSQLETRRHKIDVDYICGIEQAGDRLWAWTTDGKICSTDSSGSEQEAVFTLFSEDRKSFQAID